MQTITSIDQDRTASNDLILTDLVERLLSQLRNDGMADPLSEPLTLAAVLHDLFELAGEPIPQSLAPYLTE